MILHNPIGSLLNGSAHPITMERAGFHWRTMY